MAAKPKMTPKEWARAREVWEADPRKALPWLIQELGLPVSAEGLRLRARSEGWAKLGTDDGAKLAPEPKLAELPKPKLAPENPSLDNGAQIDGEGQPAAPVVLQKIERESGATLTPREERFVREYLIDLNATQAATRAGYSAKAARQIGSENLSKPYIATAITQAKTARAERTGITADRVLTEVHDTSTADVRELVQVKVGCCRHCWGEGGARQRTVGEMNRDKEKWAVKGKDLADFDEEGGIGFNPRREPNPECPECCGDGSPRVVLADTRTLSPAAAALYAGAKHGKHGIEVMIQSKAEAQRKVFAHLGLDKQVVEVNLNVFPPKEVLDNIYDKALAEAAEREKMLRGRRERMGIVIENGDTHD